MLKVERMEWHMVGYPEGKNTGFTTPQMGEGRSGVDARGGVEEKEGN